jgi:argininosuccinate lyase
MPFRDAYTCVGKLVALCTQRGCTLEDLTMADLRAASELFEEGYYAAIDLDRCVAERKSYGGPSPESIAAQIRALEAVLKESADD